MGYNIGPENAMCLANVLKTNTTLEKLLLTNNDIEDNLLQEIQGFIDTQKERHEIFKQNVGKLTKPYKKITKIEKIITENTKTQPK